MALSALAAGAIAAGTAVAGSAASAGIQSGITSSGKKKSQKRAYKLNEMAAENAYQRQLDQWNKINEYNLPSAAYAREIEGLRANKLSVGQFYSNGASPGSLAGSTTAPEGGGASGALNFESPDPLGNFSDILGFQSVQSQIDLNDSQAKKNRAEADYVSSREDVAASQVELNYALAGDARARSLSTELDAQLKESLLPLNVAQAEQTLALNESLLVDYQERAKRSILETRFQEDTYSDRRSIVTADLQNKVAGVILQRVQAQAVAAGIPLTEAQIDNVRTQTLLNFELIDETSTRKFTNQARERNIEAQTKLLEKNIDWFDRRSVLKVIDQFAGYWFNILELGASAAKQ